MHLSSACSVSDVIGRHGLREAINFSKGLKILWMEARCEGSQFGTLATK